MRQAVLVLEDGEVFEGVGFGAGEAAFGEVVFNTGMTGYQEVLTDPSYDGQIVTMTYPHIGNYGVNSEDVESVKPRVAGFVVRDVPAQWSSWRGEGSVDDYLTEAGIAGISEIDTRRLTRHIRSAGAMRGAIASGISVEEVIAQVKKAPSMEGADLVKHVTTQSAYEWPAPNEPRFRVAAIDFGIKFNILRELAARGSAIKVYPASVPAEEILAAGYDGVFLSNGPGDPSAVGYAVETIRALVGRIPMFGICLGHQLLALAAGLTTFKLPFGHRGANHPVIDLRNGAIEITTQNHGFAVDPGAFGFATEQVPGSPLPRGLAAHTPFGKVQLTHINLNDYTVEGIRLTEAQAFAVQYHPEAAPGPHDPRYLFDEFTDLMERHAHG